MISFNLMRNVLDMALPAAAEAAVYTIMALLDTLMIGNYGGNTAVSVVGMGSEILYSCTSIFITIGVCIGISSFVSRSIGARKNNEAEMYSSVGFTVGLIISILVCSIIYIFSRKILVISGVRVNVLELSNAFMRAMVFAVFFNMLTNVICSILRGYGNTYTPFLVSILVMTVKIILDGILIFGLRITEIGIIIPELGIMGAGIASIISQVVGFMCLFYYVMFKSTIKIRLSYVLKPKMDKCKEIFVLSFPSTLEDAAFSLSRLLCSFIIMRSGTISFAANQIANTIESISFMPGMGFGVAATTLVGIKVGERNYKEAKEYTKACAIWSVMLMTFFSIVFLLMPEILVNLFVDETEKRVLYLASLCLFIGAFEQPSIALSSVYGGALKGAGDTKTPFIISLLSSWAIRLPLVFYFIHILKFSVIYVWWVTVIQWAFDAILMMVFFERKLYFHKHRYLQYEDKV